jgi:hypothetical protein
VVVIGSVKDALMELDGVSDAGATYLENVARVDFDPDMTCIQAIMPVIGKPGFRVVP